MFFFPLPLELWNHKDNLQCLLFAAGSRLWFFAPVFPRFAGWFLMNIRPIPHALFSRICSVSGMTEEGMDFGNEESCTLVGWVKGTG